MPLTEGFIIQIPTNSSSSQTNVVMFVGRVPINVATQAIQSGASSGTYHVVSFRSPQRMHPGNMNLRSSGFPGTTDGIPLHSTRMWSLNRTSQRGTAEAWYDENLQKWRLNITPSFPDVPTNYFAPDDALIIYQPPGKGAWLWTLPMQYTEPTKNMTP